MCHMWFTMHFFYFLSYITSISIYLLYKIMGFIHLDIFKHAYNILILWSYSPHCPLLPLPVPFYFQGFLIFNVNSALRKQWCLSFCVWLILLNMISSCIHLLANDMIQFFFTYLSLSSVDGHLGWFYNSAVWNNATANKGVQVSLYGTGFDSFECTPQECWNRVMWQLFFIFWETFILLSLVAILIYMPTNSK